MGAPGLICSGGREGRRQDVSDLIKAIMNVDRVIHEPSRLAILTAVDARGSVDFQPLQAITGMAKSNLSIHLSVLEAHGLVSLDKHFVEKRARTTVRLTADGKARLHAYRRLLGTTPKTI